MQSQAWIEENRYDSAVSYHPLDHTPVPRTKLFWITIINPDQRIPLDEQKYR